MGLLLSAADLVLVAEFDPYAGHGHRDGAIHGFVVDSLYGLFALPNLRLSTGLRRTRRDGRRFDPQVFVAKTMLAPFLIVVSTAWDETYERFLGLIVRASFAGVSFAGVSALLIPRGGAALTSDPAPRPGWVSSSHPRTTGRTSLRVTYAVAASSGTPSLTPSAGVANRGRRGMTARSSAAGREGTSTRFVAAAATKEPDPRPRRRLRQSKGATA